MKTPVNSLRWYKILCFFLSFIQFSSLFAAQQEGTLLFNRFYIQDGLIGNNIVDIVQDTTGFIWVATEVGLSRYDGRNFQNYHHIPGDNSSLSNDFLYSLFISKKGDLWISTREGVSKYLPENDCFEKYIPNQRLQTNTPLNIVRSVAESSDGTIYFLVEGGYLYSISNGEINTVLHLQTDYTKFMIIDEEDICWISAGKTIYQFDIRSNLTRQYELKIESHVSDFEITQMIRTGNTLLISAYNSDIIEFNFRDGTIQYLNVANEFSHVVSMFLEKDKLMAATSDGLKILNLNTGKIEKYTHEINNIHSLSSRDLRKIYRDNQGNIWVGTKKGLNVSYTSKGFSGYSLSYNNFPENLNVTAIHIDREERIWLGHGAGLQIRDKDFNSLWPFKPVEPILPIGPIGETFRFFEDSQGYLWIGTYINGLLKYNPYTQVLEQYYPGKTHKHIAGADVRAVMEDGDGNIWIAIHGQGIFVMKKDSDQFISLFDYIPGIPWMINDKWVFDILFDQKGDLWLASSTGAIYYNFESKSHKIFGSDVTGNLVLSNLFVNTIFFDDQWNIWLGTLNGLNILSSDHSTLKIYNQTNGLPNSDIRAINQDSDGIMWVASRNGISRLEPLGNLEFMVTNYDMSHGLSTNDFNLKSTFYDPDGVMYFGGIFGFTRFEPHKVNIDLKPPRVILTNFYMFDRKVPVSGTDHSSSRDQFYLEKSLPFSKKIVLSERLNMIGFEFAALTIANSSRNQYRYILEGFDIEWRDIGNRNMVYFTNLKPGKYKLMVMGSNSDGTWSETPAQVELVIKPLFWKSNYAIAFYFALVLMISLFLIHISVQRRQILLEVEQQKKLRDLRTRFFMNVSHELKTPLTLISIPLAKIMNQYKENQTPPSMHDISIISRNVNRLMRIMEQIFDFRKVELNKVEMALTKNSIISFTQDIISYFEYQVSQKQITLQTYFPEEDVELYFDTDKMEKIIYNLVSNSVKFTPATGGQITIEIQTIQKTSENHKRYLQWIIKDNGKGIRKNNLEKVFERYSYLGEGKSANYGGTGIGLSIVKSFVELHHGKILIDSNSKKDGYEKSFTHIVLEFPMDDEWFKDLINETEPAELQFKEPALYMTGTTDLHKAIDLQRSNESMGEEFRPTILVVDDDKDLCVLMCRELSERYKVILAYDGEEGLQKAGKHHPDLVISDVMMPGMDGYELCKKIKTNLETSHIPVILLTSKSMEEDEGQSYLTGADTFITKPFDLDQLILRINSLIKNRINLKNAFLSAYGIELKNVVPTRTDEKFIQNLLKIINNHISDPDLNVDKIIPEIGMSRSQLYKKINTVANTSVNLFIRKVRLKRASELLLEGKMNITEIAYSVGFENLSYFSSCFQAEYGMSPTKYASSKMLNLE
jgi:signal transduction histidine kinase/ligand-binding sensor domain-containing protein/AraC-like DNA-binding protein